MNTINNNVYRDISLTRGQDMKNMQERKRPKCKQCQENQEENNCDENDDLESALHPEPECFTSDSAPGSC